MLPLPTPRIFRSRWGALRWALLVIVGAALTAGFPDEAPRPTTPVDATGQPVDHADAQALAALLNAS